jgi:hypothetical protein
MTMQPFYIINKNIVKQYNVMSEETLNVKDNVKETDKKGGKIRTTSAKSIGKNKDPNMGLN